MKDNLREAAILFFVLIFCIAAVWIDTYGIPCFENYPLGEKIDSILRSIN